MTRAAQVRIGGKEDAQTRSQTSPLLATGRLMNDILVRSALHEHLRGIHQDEGTIVVDELGVRAGTARIDVVAINGALHAYEIKSDRDTLSRLRVQAQIFSEIADFATLVAARRHIGDALNIVPDWWGIVSADLTEAGVSLNAERPAQRNPNPEASSVVELLWRDEAYAILEEVSASHGVRSANKHRLQDRLLQTFSLDDLHDRVLAALRARENWRPAERQRSRAGSFQRTATS